MVKEVVMLKQSSLERKEFKHEELALMKKLDFNDIEIIQPDNLGQILIWTSKLLNIIMLNLLNLVRVKYF